MYIQCSSSHSTSIGVKITKVTVTINPTRMFLFTMYTIPGAFLFRKEKSDLKGRKSADGRGGADLVLIFPLCSVVNNWPLSFYNAMIRPCHKSKKDTKKKKIRKRKKIWIVWLPSSKRSHCTSSLSVAQKRSHPHEKWRGSENPPCG